MVWQSGPFSQNGPKSPCLNYLTCDFLILMGLNMNKKVFIEAFFSLNKRKVYVKGN
jgi:hypothetical protein